MSGFSNITALPKGISNKIAFKTKIYLKTSTIYYK